MAEGDLRRRGLDKEPVAGVRQTSGGGAASEILQVCRFFLCYHKFTWYQTEKGRILYGPDTDSWKMHSKDAKWIRSRWLVGFRSVGRSIDWLVALSAIRVINSRVSDVCAQFRLFSQPKLHQWTLLSLSGEYLPQEWIDILGVGWFFCSPWDACVRARRNSTSTQKWGPFTALVYRGTWGDLFPGMDSPLYTALLSNTAESRALRSSRKKCSVFDGQSQFQSLSVQFCVGFTAAVGGGGGASARSVEEGVEDN